MYVMQFRMLQDLDVGSIPHGLPPHATHPGLILRRFEVAITQRGLHRIAGLQVCHVGHEACDAARLRDVDALHLPPDSQDKAG